MSDLPAGWSIVRLGDFLQVIRGASPRPKGDPKYFGGSIPWISIRDINAEQGKYLTKTAEGVTEAGAAKSRLLEPGTLILSNSGSVCLPKILKIPGCIHDGFVTFPNLKTRFDTDYFYYMFEWMRPSVIANHRQGMTQVNLNTEIVRNFSIPVAPLNEQRRIADKLNTLLAKVDGCHLRLERVPKILSKFREAVLEAAVSGRLTEEWRSQNGTRAGTGRSVVERDALSKQAVLARFSELSKKKSTIESEMDAEYLFEIPESWAFSTWGTLSEWVTYGFTRPMPHADIGVPLVTAKNVLNFQVTFDATQNTTAFAFGKLSEKDRPKKGDLLLTKDGTIGRAALVNSDGPFCINQSVAVVWLRSTSIVRRYLEMVANAAFTQKFIRNKAKGMAIQHLSITDFAQCPVPVPPSIEQVEVVRRVDELFAFADSLERKHEEAISGVEKLTPAVLAKAFRGGLVPQDSNDEPASRMLERLSRDTQQTRGPRRTSLLYE